MRLLLIGICFLRRSSRRGSYLASIKLQPEAAYPYQAIGNLYFLRDPYQTDSLAFWTSQAVLLSPNWLAPYLDISSEYQNAQNDLERAEEWLLKGLIRHPKSYFALEQLSWLKQWQGKPDESISISKEMIEIKPDLFNAYSTTAITLTIQKGEYLESEKYASASIALETNQWYLAQAILALDYLRSRRAKLAVRLGDSCIVSSKTSIFDKITLLPTLTAALVQLECYDSAEVYFRLFDSLQFGPPYYKTMIKMTEGRMYLQQGMLTPAEKTLEMALLIDPTDDAIWITIWALLGEIKAKQGQLKAAEALFKKAVSFRKIRFDENLFRDEALFRYGKFLLKQNRSIEAELQFLEIGKILPKSYFYGYGMALLFAKQGKCAEALEWLEKSLDNFYPDSKSIMEEPLFKKIRKTERFKAMMLKNFPPVQPLKE